MNCHATSRAGEEEEDDDEVETQFQREDDSVHKDRSVKFNFPSLPLPPSLFCARAAPTGKNLSRGL